MRKAVFYGKRFFYGRGCHKKIFLGKRFSGIAKQKILWQERFSGRKCQTMSQFLCQTIFRPEMPKKRPEMPNPGNFLISEKNDPISSFDFRKKLLAQLGQLRDGRRLGSIPSAGITKFRYDGIHLVRRTSITESRF